MNYSSGEVYIGSWKDDKKNGFGMNLNYVQEKLICIMDIIIKENGKMILCMVKGYLQVRMVKFIMAGGRMVSKMDTVYYDS